MKLMWLVLSVAFIFGVGVIYAQQWALTADSNNVVGSNGYLLDNSSAFLLDDVDPGNGKIFAR
jgi:hypothetical protein